MWTIVELRAQSETFCLRELPGMFVYINHKLMCKLPCFYVLKAVTHNICLLTPQSARLLTSDNYFNSIITSLMC